MGHGDLLFHITVGGLGCRAPGGQPGRRAGHPGAPRSGRRTRLHQNQKSKLLSAVSCQLSGQGHGGIVQCTDAVCDRHPAQSDVRLTHLSIIAVALKIIAVACRSSRLLRTPNSKT